MSKPRLGFKLWKRKILKNFKASVSPILKALNSVLGILLAILGLYLAYTANNLATQGNLYSKSSYELAKNDTSQQVQIVKLTELVNFQKSQMDTLVKIVSELRTLNATSSQEIAVVSKQTDLLSDNSKPLLRDVDYFFTPVEKGDFTKKIDFTVITKNFGQRPAYNLTPTIFFVKVSDGKIESHGRLRPPEYEKYQSILYPGESKKYTVVSNFSPKGLSDLNSLVTVIRYVFFDKAVNRQDTTTFYYEHSVKGTTYSIKIARPEIKTIVEQYLKSKRL